MKLKTMFKKSILVGSVLSAMTISSAAMASDEMKKDFGGFGVETYGQLSVNYDHSDVDAFGVKTDEDTFNATRKTELGIKAEHAIKHNLTASVDLLTGFDLDDKVELKKAEAEIAAKYGALVFGKLEDRATLAASQQYVFGDTFKGTELGYQTQPVYAEGVAFVAQPYGNLQLFAQLTGEEFGGELGDAYALGAQIPSIELGFGEVGLSGTFQSSDVELAGADQTINEYRLGTSYMYGPVTAKAAYTAASVEIDSIGLDEDYTEFTVGLAYAVTADITVMTDYTSGDYLIGEDADQVRVGATYDLGEGFIAEAAYGYADSKDADYRNDMFTAGLSYVF